jgi:hypothetical protein
MPWIRISPYIMGIFYGLIFKSYKEGKNPLVSKIAYIIKTKVSVRIIMYLIGITFTSTVVFMTYPL